MAYAAVTSLKGTLHLHFLQSQPRFPLQHKQEIVNSLHENLGFLQEILEKTEISAYDNSVMKDLQAQIRDVAFKAEEKIEMELTTIYPARGWTKRLPCLLRLHGIFNEAVKQTNYLKKKLIKIKSKEQFAKGPSILGRMRQRGLLLGSTSSQPADPERNLSVVHRNLETLSWLDSWLCKKDLFKMIPNLKKLGIYGGYDNVYFFHSFLHLGQLEKLNIIRWHKLIRIPCSGIPWATGFLPNLKKLKFFMTNFAWCDMRFIGMLPNLEVLKLKRAIASKDRMWEPSEEGFPQLKRLVIEDRYLEHWNAVGDSFPVLECLELRNCYSLQEIPSGFADITTLALIQLNWCWDSVLASAKLIQEEQYNNYGNALLVRSECIMTKRVNNKEEELDVKEESDLLVD
nr:putative late blight resistance protein homolog R1A-4 [Ipomoea batatas]